MKYYGIVSVLAVIIAPIASVWINQLLQDRAARRKDKMDLFKILMTARNGWTPESVRALNILDVVFYDDKKVREAWRNYYDKLRVENPSETELSKIQEAQYDLLMEMADSLGYKDRIAWNAIQNPYIPKGMIEEIDNQKIYKEGQLALAEIVMRMNQGDNLFNK